ncbi:hypothetical protein JVT61DRAFT_4953 [Boletus reticuloceps]|uniref:Amine oxidase domain-containing protein n=1 Tax=Boletus reticuloceps TaxID=495285 RepID=A0A8I2YW78_9AGAM|nr:hypothetical protein JVT61DRAFT_4953 [Boletus reticuloceps]
MPFDGDPLAYYGKRVIEHHHATLLKNLPPFKADPNDPNPFDISDDVLRFLPRLKVGILGAGAGGLYTALILDSLGIDYEILEASDRTGGRLSTYKFLNGGKYDYYEAGAMRFPLPKKDEQGNYKNGTMKRLAELTEYGPLNKGQDKLKEKLVPYYYTVREGSKPGFYYFNGVFEAVSDKPMGSFDAEGMKVSADYAAAGADAINSDITNPFIRMLIDDIQNDKTTGWDVMKANDSYSIRAYMASKYLPSYNLNLPPQHLSNNVANWCALLGGSHGAGSGGYDRALTEAVLESMAFASVGNTDYGDVDWKCFEGGSQTLSNKMADYIKSRGVSIQFQKRVTSIGQGYIHVSLPRGFPKNKIPSSVEIVPSESTPVDIEVEEKHVPNVPLDGASSTRLIVKIPCVQVKVNGNETKRYSHVVSTLPIPVLRTVDLNSAGLNVLQKNALRTLDYGPSIKIGVLFKSDWWKTKLGIVGGQSYTDLPIRTIVYPSYGVDASPPCKVLIASYSWTTDAFRLGALATEKERDVLKDLVLRNLAEAHSRLNPEITYEYLKGEFVDMNVKDWNQDELTMGAFAFFSPGEFDDLYTSLNAPAANNRLHFAGEALSTRHAWVVGALDSAWRAVYQYLKVTGQNDKIKKFKEIWGENLEWTSNSTLLDPEQYGELVPDMLDQHLGLVNKAVQGGVIAQRK